MLLTHVEHNPATGGLVASHDEEAATKLLRDKAMLSDDAERGV